MKRTVFLFLFGLLTAISYAQDFKPCATAMLAKRHKAQNAKTRQSSQEEIRHYEGEKKGLIILVEFADVHFATDNPLQTWSDIANKQGYSENEAIGSVSDYFYDQSYGKFRLTFDVVGPVVAAHNHEYYGENKDWGPPTGWFDKNVGELVEEACKGVADKVNFADYDWDNDGEVDQVFLLYAGRGENDYGRKDSTVIWPHMASLILDWDYKDGVVIQGKRINIYACSNEIWSNSLHPHLAGIGTFCHEFSHCLGLPDLYNTEEGNSVLGDYDLMDYGSYLGEGWCPVGYSSYERYVCGWLTPEPTDDPAAISGLSPLHTSPDVRIYRTSADANDYYLIENRKKESWDRYFPKAGLMAWHIDYDKEVWMNNEVNNDPNHLRVERMTVGNIPTAIADISSEDKQIIGVYDLHGRPADASSSRFQIIRYSDGTSQKKMATR
ncbi:MAG: M6 family metalloprotease domain-containing protein [Prevotella sp.]|nr:M6 family metalloprotease domain-containing protein [Prevotella sp.]